MSEENPLFLTTRKYKARIRERDAARRELATHANYLGLAREIREQTLSRMGEIGEEEALDLAIARAREAEMRRLVEEHARTMRAKLTEQQEAELRRQFTETERERIDREVAEEVRRQEADRRAKIARKTEAELKKLGTEALLALIDTDEAKQTRERFGKIAIDKAKHEAMIEELKSKAEISSCVDIIDLPTDLVFSVGFGASPNSKQQKFNLSNCDRVLKLRVLEPTQGILEVIDDSWMASDDVVRRGNALEDLLILTMPNNQDAFKKPRFSRGAEPDFISREGAAINMYGLEALMFAIGDGVIFS